MPKPGIGVSPLQQTESETRLAPLYHVVLLDDQQHTYEYVIELVTKIFRKPVARAFEHAVEVDKTGRSILATCPLEQAEFKRDQIKGFGGDHRLKSETSMHSVVEPAE